jgi:hypothetical protein
MVTFYRPEFDAAVENLSDFFSDYYRVRTAAKPEDIPAETDILNILEADRNSVSDSDFLYLWIETEEKQESDPPLLYGPMKKLYIQLFLDQCSA